MTLNGKLEISGAMPKFATAMMHYALAQNPVHIHKDGAFQASSPKTFLGLVGNDRAFFLPMAGRRSPNVRKPAQFWSAP